MQEMNCRVRLQPNPLDPVTGIMANGAVAPGIVHFVLFKMLAPVIACGIAHSASMSVLL